MAAPNTPIVTEPCQPDEGFQEKVEQVILWVITHARDGILRVAIFETGIFQTFELLCKHRGQTCRETAADADEKDAVDQLLHEPDPKRGHGGGNQQLQQLQEGVGISRFSKLILPNIESLFIFDVIRHIFFKIIWTFAHPTITLNIVDICFRGEAIHGYLISILCSMITPIQQLFLRLFSIEASEGL